MPQNPAKNSDLEKMSEGSGGMAVHCQHEGCSCTKGCSHSPSNFTESQTGLDWEGP